MWVSFFAIWGKMSKITSKNKLIRPKKKRGGNSELTDKVLIFIKKTGQTSKQFISPIDLLILVSSILIASLLKYKNTLIPNNFITEVILLFVLAEAWGRLLFKGILDYLVVRSGLLFTTIFMVGFIIFVTSIPVARTYSIGSWAMAPYLAKGDVVLTDTYFIDFFGLQRNDIVFYDEDHGGQIKALPGQLVDIRVNTDVVPAHNELYIDNKFSRANIQSYCEFSSSISDSAKQEMSDYVLPPSYYLLVFPTSDETFCYVVARSNIIAEAKFVTKGPLLSQETINQAVDEAFGGPGNRWENPYAEDLYKLPRRRIGPLPIRNLDNAAQSALVIITAILHMVVNFPKGVGAVFVSAYIVNSWYEYFKCGRRQKQTITEENISTPNGNCLTLLPAILTETKDLEKSYNAYERQNNESTKARFQTPINYGRILIIGIAFIATLADAVNNLLLITPWITYIGTAIIVILLVFLYSQLQRGPIEISLARDKQLVIDSITFEIWLIVLGVLVGLWLPRLY